MYKRELRQGHKVVIKKPKNVLETPCWSADMDKYDGEVVTLHSATFSREDLFYCGYRFSSKWLHCIPDPKNYHRLEIIIIQDCKTFKNFAVFNNITTLCMGYILNNVTFVTPKGVVRTIPKAEVLGRLTCFSSLINYANRVPSKCPDYYAEIDSIEEIKKPDYGIKGPKGMPGVLEISDYEELDENSNNESASKNTQIIVLSFPGSSKQYAYANVTDTLLSSGYINDFGWVTSSDELKDAERAKIENTFPNFEEYLKANRLNAFSQDLNDYSCIYRIGSFEPCESLTVDKDEAVSDKAKSKWLYLTNTSSVLCNPHPESAIIFPESKKESKMNFLSSLNINCGKVDDPNLTASLNGVAIKGLDGQFRAYDKSKDKIMNVTGLTLGNDYLYILPCALKDVKVGDVIVNADTFVTVVKVHNDGTFTVVDPKASEQKIAVPAQNIFGFNYVSKIVNLLDGMINPSDDNPFGINPLMFVLLDETKSNNNSNLLLATILMEQNGNMDINSMLPFLLMGKGDNNMLAMFALVSAMKSQEKPKRGLRAKSKVIENTTDTSNFSFDELCAAFDKILAERTKEKLDNAPVPAPIEDDSKPKYLIDDSGFVNYVPDGIVSYETDSAD